MKEGWEEKTLKEVSTIAGDYGLSVPSKPFDGVRYLRITDITDWGDLNDDIVSANVDSDNKQEELEEGDILFARTGATVGKTLVYKKEFGKCLFAGYLIRYRLNKDIILPRYMYYVTHSKEYYDWVFVNQEAAAQPNISAKKYNLLPVKYPPLSEQQRIVSRLDAAFAHIDELKANVEKQLSEARTLFQKALTKAMEPQKGWKEDILVNVLNFIDYRGSTPNKLTEGVPLVTAKNVKFGYIDYTIKDFISREEYNSRKSRGISHKGDLLFTTEAPLGNVAIADLDEFSAGQRLITLQQYDKPKYKTINEFYYYYMLGSVFQKRIKELATGATAQGIKAKLLKTVLVPIPPLSEQQRIVSRLDSLSAHVRELEEVLQKTIAECDALKQAILRQVFE